jgi:hypothetical protein
MIAPVQRLARYKVLIEAILKQIDQENDNKVYLDGLALIEILDNVSYSIFSY